MQKYNKFFMAGLCIAAVMGIFAAFQLGPATLLGSLGTEHLSEVEIPTGSDTNVRESIVKALNILISFLALFAVVTIVISGFVFILGLGTESSIARAKKIIIYTIIGILVVFFSSMIVSFFTEELAGDI